MTECLSRCFIKISIYKFNCIKYNPIFDTCDNQKGSKPLYNQGFRAFIYTKKCSYFSSFFIIVKIFFIFLFDTISKSVLKPEISCKASVRSVLS